MLPSTHNPNGISTGSAIYAQFMAESRQACCVADIVDSSSSKRDQRQTVVFDRVLLTREYCLKYFENEIRKATIRKPKGKINLKFEFSEVI